MTGSELIVRKEAAQFVVSSEHMTDRRFNHDQARDILRRAERKTDEVSDEELSERELRETAKELGISDEQLERAISERDREDDLATALRSVKSDRRAALRGHLVAYFIFNASTAFVNLQLGKPYWFLWPAFFWSLWLIVHVVSFVMPDNDKLIARAQRRVRSRRWRERGKKLGQKLEKNVGELIDRATKE